MDENLARLTQNQKTEEPKSNKRNFEVWSNKKVATAHPPFLHQPHQVYFPFSAENLVPPTPTPFNEVGCFQLSNTKKCLNLGNNWCVHVKEKSDFFKVIFPTKKSESPNFVWMRHWIRSCHSPFSHWNSLKYFAESFLTFLKLLSIKLLFGFQEKLLLLLVKHRLADKHLNYSSWSKVLWKIFDIWKIMQNILYSST